LLDGSPVVKDIVFDRSASDVSAAVLNDSANLKYQKWHTTLVSGFGQRRGYYALDVTNPGPGVYDPQAATSSEGFTQSTTTTYFDTTTKKVPGPQFLWQLTDFPVPPGSPDEGPVVRNDVTGAKRASMFGLSTGNPVITTLFFDPAGGTDAHEIGVVIIPGGMEDSAISGRCKRGTNVTPPGFTAIPASATTPVLSPTGFAERQWVRRWDKGTGDCDGPVPGRSVTIVRADNGEILRVFARPHDVPPTFRIDARMTSTLLDSPMTGTPVLYPSGLGSIAQKAFIGDADGTIWRFDLSSRNPKDWKGSLFFDTQTNTSVADATADETDGQPILVSPVLAVDEKGSIMLGVSTGEQDSLTPPLSGDNFVYSVSEDFSGGTPKTKMNWFSRLEGGERVTGPMTVFDGVFYYATFKPPSSAGNVCTKGKAYIYGCDYLKPNVAGNVASGCAPRTFLDNIKYPTQVADGKLDEGNELVPGVSIRSLQACSNFTIEEFAQGGITGPEAFSGGGYELIIPKAKQATGGGSPQRAETKAIKLPFLSRPSRIDSWASIIE
jgi:type IV pilus assembly protein PilY1